MASAQGNSVQSHILAVCTANVCRSPMAERLIAHALAAEEEPWRSIPVLSAGVSAGPGQSASENSVRALRKVGIDLTDHRSQPVTEELIRNALAVIAMTESHRMMIESWFPDVEVPILLMREVIAESGDTQIPDPFGMTLEAYEATRDSMVETLPALVAYIKTLKPGSAGGDSGRA